LRDVRAVLAVGPLNRVPEALMATYVGQPGREALRSSGLHPILMMAGYGMSGQSWRLSAATILYLRQSGS